MTRIISFSSEPNVVKPGLQAGCLAPECAYECIEGFVKIRKWGKTHPLGRHKQRESRSPTALGPALRWAPNFTRTKLLTTRCRDPRGWPTTKIRSPKGTMFRGPKHPEKRLFTTAFQSHHK